jgi:hypothetical protein
VNYDKALRIPIYCGWQGPSMTGTGEKAARTPGTGIRLVELFEVHAGVEAGDLVGVSVEHLCGDGAG